MAGDTTNRLAGTAYVTVNGVTVMVEGSFKYQTSTVNRTTLTGMDGVHGYKEKPVTTQKDSGVVQEIQYQTPLEVASAPRLSDFGFSSGLPAGSDVVIAFLGGDRSSPVVIASNHQSYRHTGLKPGETVVYNQQGMNIHLTEAGIFIDAKGKDVEINNARNITATATEQVKLVTANLK